jgi:hypothetical protein
MDVSNNIRVPLVGTFSGGGGGADIKPQVKLPVPQSTEAAPKVKAPETAEKALYEEVKRTAESVKSLFVVSDVRFTIFKDVAGDYVTRFTSLKDGSVKYFPQKSLYEMMQIRQANLHSFFDTEA